MEFISQFVEQEFPQFIQSNGSQFVDFIQAYYEWMEYLGNVENIAFNLPNFRDVDATPDQFLNHFQYEFMANLPANIAANPRLLIKHIVNLYQSKGTKRGFALLFRVLFNEDIKLYLPGTDVFKPSDNTWVQPVYIEVSDSAFLPQLVGQSIYDLNSGATALVEAYDVIISNQKVINVLSLSNIQGLFLFGDTVMSRDVSFTANQAPSIVGSLSAAAIINGGIFWNVGDLVNLTSTSGVGGALARVATTTSENGKVIFTLENGGFGFTTNAVVQVLGGGGSGASFSVGSLVDEQIFAVSIDEILPYYNTQLDIQAEGFQLNYVAQTGIFSVNEIVISTCANSMQLDFSYLPANASYQTSNNMTYLETLANTTLGISVEIVNLQNPNWLTVTGTNANLNLLLSGVILTSNVTHSILKINSPMTGIQQNSCNGQVTFTNSTCIQVKNANGYFLPTSNVDGQTSGAHANLNSVTRLTNWTFPAYSVTNLDTLLNVLLTYENLTIGTIASLKNQDPGALYASNPTVVIEEPLIAQLGISDGTGGIWGFDANVTANAVFANGIATSLQIVSSGYGFEPGDILEGTNSNNVSSIQASAIVDLNGIAQGYWTSNKSMLSTDKYLQDSYYYQNFSFEIGAPRDLNTYANTVLALMAPIGFAMFGKFWMQDSQSCKATLSYDSTVQLAANGATVYSGG